MEDRVRTQNVQEQDLTRGREEKDTLSQGQVGNNGVGEGNDTGTPATT